MIQKPIIILILFAAFAAVALCAAGAPGAQSQKTVLDGVYTEAQAGRGEETFTRYCARCHGSNLDGIGAAPMLYSAQFVDRWREDSLSAVFDYISTNMPLDATPKPGGLTEAQYLDIISYLLSFNEYPAGDKELTRADVEKTQLVGLDGPKPLPPSALVRVAGCLAQNGDAWTLVRSSAPARVRKGDTTDADELKKSAGTPFGAQEFRLPNLTEDHKSSELAAQVSKKVQVKGVLNGQGSAARISVLSFEPLGLECPK